MRALGVDVGVRKGCHAVLVDGRTVERRERVTADALRALIEAEQPDVVGIDSPPAFAAGDRARAAEADLNRRGIRLFCTPDASRAAGNRFFDWMRVGFECFAAAGAAGYPRCLDGLEYRRRALEVFPHASAVVLRGTLPAPRSSKVRRRREVLESHGVRTEALRNVDEVDAALGALTGVLALEGAATAVGDPTDGVIVVPARTLLGRYPRPRVGICAPRDR